MSDRDVDAEFADIIARWDEVESLPDRVDPAGPDFGSDFGSSSGPSSGSTSGPDPLTGEPNRPATSVNPPLQPSVNPPPTRPFVVWRGAEQPPPAEPAELQSEPGPAELMDLDDEDDHFEPGPTAPLPPQEDLQFWGIIVGLVAGPLILLWLVLFRPNVSDWWTLGALGLTVLGFVLLVMRQPHSRAEDDPDNGARV
jgi:hypothetical protein